MNYPPLSGSPTHWIDSKADKNIPYLSTYLNAHLCLPGDCPHLRFDSTVNNRAWYKCFYRIALQKSDKSSLITPSTTRLLRIKIQTEIQTILTQLYGGSDRPCCSRWQSCSEKVETLRSSQCPTPFDNPPTSRDHCSQSQSSTSSFHSLQSDLLNISRFYLRLSYWYWTVIRRQIWHILVEFRPPYCMYTWFHHEIHDCLSGFEEYWKY